MKKTELLYDLRYNKDRAGHNITLFTQYAISGTNKIMFDIICPRKYFKKTKYSIPVKRTSDEILHSKINRINNINRCKDKGYVEKVLLKKKEETQLLLSERGCNSRFCSHCIDKFQTINRIKGRNVVKSYGISRFMTVSFKVVNDLTSDYIKKCSNEFNLMRKYLKREINPFTNEPYTLGNYINVMEIKVHLPGDPMYHSQKIGGKWVKTLVGHYIRKCWNLHYHIIYEGDYIPVKLARECLNKATKGESFYVTIEFISKEKIRNKQKALNYITKYISKMKFESDDYALMYEWFNATKKQKFVKIVGKRPILTRSKEFEVFSDYLENEKYDYYQSQEFILNTTIFMETYGLKFYDYEMSQEENFFKYAKSKMIVDNLKENE